MSNQFIILFGNIRDGVEAFGPFPDRDSAQTWLDHRGLKLGSPAYIMELTNPLDS